MTRNFLLLLFTAALFATPQILAAPEEGPVTATVELTADDKQSDQYTLTVSLNVKEGWHIYDDAGDAGTSTALKLVLPTGAKKVGEWDRPFGEPDANFPEIEVFKGLAEFSCEITANKEAIGKLISVSVDYQACTDEYCNRATSKKLSVEIKKAAEKKTLPKVAKPKVQGMPLNAKFPKYKKISAADVTGPGYVSDTFEVPLLLTVNDKPLVSERDRYPSPAIYDIDGDGVNELIVGGLRGSVGVFENSNESGKGDPVWEPRQELTDAEGKRIETTNW